MIKVEQDNSNLSIFFNDRIVLTHSASRPFIEVGRGEGSFLMKGDKSVSVKDKILFKVPLLNAFYDSERMLLRFSGGEYTAIIQLLEDESSLTLKFQRLSPKINRVFLSLPANPELAVYGCGDHLDGMDLRGQRIISWVSPGEHHGGNTSMSFIKGLVNRNNVRSSAFTTPFYVNSDFSYVYIETNAYTVLDFSMGSYHPAEIWGVPESLVIGAANKYPELTDSVSKLFGRQTVLPQWVSEGAWLDVSGGTAKILETLERAIKSGIKVSALIIRDWSSGSDKPFWDWALNSERYPRLDELMRELSQRNLRVLAYINPHLSIEGRLFAEAANGGYLVKNEKNSNLLTDMGGFMAGLIDLTNNDACIWYKQIIKDNILKAGFSGFIADMGEFLPLGAVFKSGESAEILHNKWPLMWARLAREAIRETGRSDILFISRSGYSQSPGEAMLLSLSGKKPSWSGHDGLKSAISSALSAGICGMGLVSSKIGGEHGGTMHRCSKELFMRWTEFSAFTPVMDTNTGHGSDSGWRFDSDEETTAHFSKMSRIHAALSPYIKQCIKINSNNATPVMRPLSFSFPDDIRAVGTDDAYMLGDDLLVAPVVENKKRERPVYIPKGSWIHLWSDREYTGSNTVIEAPIGMPPVFFKSKSKYRELFETIKDIL